jgi:hypothetical protein
VRGSANRSPDARKRQVDTITIASALSDFQPHPAKLFWMGTRNLQGILHGHSLVLDRPVDSSSWRGPRHANVALRTLPRYLTRPIEPRVASPKLQVHVYSYIATRKIHRNCAPWIFRPGPRTRLAGLGHGRILSLGTRAHLSASGHPLSATVAARARSPSLF